MDSWEPSQSTPAVIRGGQAKLPGAPGTQALPSHETGEQHHDNPLPSVNLPTGGGAIRGIGEKFTVNAVTGTASTSVPIPISTSRGEFGPSLSLSYDSGSGNGPFGFGWQLSIPSITRKTDKGLPQYSDDQESDVFILAGSEDLVPVLMYENGIWRCPDPKLVDEGRVRYEIRRYRPRIEGSFMIIERWTELYSQESHWRTITGNNVTTVFGDSSNSRIFDPIVPQGGNQRIFKWLMSRSWDDKGNSFVYEYKAEDSAGIDCLATSEVHRTDLTRSSQRYLKRVKYGNRVSHLIDRSCTNPDWMFEVVFDYGEHCGETPSSQEFQPWELRSDPFSVYRSCFEVRTYRLCRRVLMYHRFPKEDNIGQNCLVSSLDIAYSQADDKSFNTGNRIAAFISSFTQRAYQREGDGYIHKALPPLEFKYTEPVVSNEIHDLNHWDILQLPFGLDEAVARWIDLDGEGIPGILTKQGDFYYYKANLGRATFESARLLDPIPPPAGDQATTDQWMDLAGDGHLNLVRLGGRAPGFYRRSNWEWQQFKPFDRLPNTLASATAVQHLDLTGDGLTDVLIANDEVFTWYASLGEAGYGDAQYARTPVSEEYGIRLLTSDPTEAIYAADMSGDGLSDLVRIRNGDICYWPNIGYGLFGNKVVMDNAPWFDYPDRFHQKRLRLFDIDGSGTTDLIYLGSHGTFYYQNECGNGWSLGREILSMPRFEDTAQVQVTDLKGNGTGTLIWSSTSPADFGHHIRYIDLMGGQKPHLLTSQTNNLGMESHIHYASSTKFYLRDKAAGRPWATRLAFPVQVVERQETFDYVSKNRFVSRYAYHHGFFDGIEREFRGFGMVEQLDTEEFATFSKSTDFPAASNLDSSSHIPPVLTKTWFHTGAYDEGAAPSRAYERDYYREVGLTEDEFQALLLPDTVMPTTLRVHSSIIPHTFSLSDSREACRALKGKTLRQEVYALDRSEAQHMPYKVSESNFTIDALQPIACNKNGIFLTHGRESIDFHYERKLFQSSLHKRRLADPRLSHSMTLLTDEYANPLLSASVVYGRRFSDNSPRLSSEDRFAQQKVEIMFTEAKYTNTVRERQAYRIPVQYEGQQFQLLNFGKALSPKCSVSLYSRDEVRHAMHLASDGLREIPYEDFNGSQVQGDCPYRRLLKHNLSTFRADDLSTELPLGQLQSLGLPYMSYEKATSNELALKIYVESGKVENHTELRKLMLEGGFVQRENDDSWWHPSGRVFYSPASSDGPGEELAYAREHFFSAHRFRDPFYSPSNDTETFVRYDDYDLLVQETRDALDNRITSGMRNVDPTLPLIKSGLDYRLLKTVLVMDANRNCVTLAHDVLGYVAGSAILGKPEENEGDSFEGFDANLSEEIILAHFKSPLQNSAELLGKATTRYVYDTNAFQRDNSQGSATGTPTRMSTIARNKHTANMKVGEVAKLMQNISYFDGFGRTIQAKSYAGPGSLMYDFESKVNIDLNSNNPKQKRLRDSTVPHRWITSGWTIYNNKGDAVRRYEPFYSSFSTYEFGLAVGVTATIFYDPLERVVATLFPDNSWSKTMFGPWKSEQWDANDTVTRNPLADPDVGDYFQRLSRNPVDSFGSQRRSKLLSTWYEQRIDGQMGHLERKAAIKASAHADTPTLLFLDSMGRTFLTAEHNRRLVSQNVSHGLAAHREKHGIADGDSVDEHVCDRTIYDIEGNKRAIIDALGRKICIYDWDMSGTKLHQSSMEAGELWMLHDVSHSLIYGWDARGQRFHTLHDVLRRAVEVHLRHDDDKKEALVEKTVYGDLLQNPEQRNLRQRPYQVFDQAGTVSSELYDFKGNILKTQRQFAQQYKGVLDWSDEVELEGDPLVQDMAYDAVNRKISETMPDRSTLYYQHNDVGLIQRIQVQLEGGEEKTEYLKDLEYNARGQRLWVEHGNNSVTTTTYDEETFHLRKTVTYRKVKSPTRQRHPGTDRDCSIVQHLRYTYDPIGNVTHIEDGAQQTIFFRNNKVDPSADYTYDALYRLVEATGREHPGQVSPDGASVSQAPAMPSHEAPSHDHAHNEAAMSRYTERYSYDMVGNILQLHHCSADQKQASWTRKFGYDEPSLIEPEKACNRLSQLTRGSSTQAFRYDGPEGHKEQRKMQLALKLHSTDMTPEANEYERSLSVSNLIPLKKHPLTISNSKNESTSAAMNSSQPTPGTSHQPNFQRQTLHIADEARSFALIDIRTLGEEKHIPRQVTRYQLTNAISSVACELDANGALISYEEYSPYGDTTYSSFNNTLGSPKRYRYAGKEKDEESGLYYYGARYYLPLALRWLSPDPGGLKDGPNLYQFTKCNPVTKTDLTGTEATLWNRAMGAAQAVGGALEIAAGAAGLAAPTGVTQVLGAVAVVHGADTAWAGLKQAWTGEEQKTYTQQAATKAAEAAGASQKTAENIGVGVDAAIGILPDAAAVVAKQGPKLLSKAGGALSKAGTVLREGGGAVKKMAIEATADLAKSGKAVLEKGAQYLDEVKQVLTAPVQVLAMAGGPQTAGHFMMSVINEGKAAVAAGGRAVEGRASRALTAAEEKLVSMARDLEAAGIKGKEWHHVFPQADELRGMFRAAGINVHEWVFHLDKSAHKIIHNKQGQKIAEKLGMEWNEVWMKFQSDMKAQGITPSPEMIHKQLDTMMNEFGLKIFLEEAGGAYSTFKGFFMKGMDPSKLDNWGTETAKMLLKR